METLVNLTNFHSDRELIGHSSDGITSLLEEFGFDGIELMLCEPWDPALHPSSLIKGCHLPFYPNWLDFWLGNEEALVHDFPTEALLRRSFGATTPAAWVEHYGARIRAAAETNPAYMVFHVANVRYEEAFSWGFYYDDATVIRETLRLLEKLEPYLPENTWLLLENLWWPGLRLTDFSLTEKILKESPHAKTGIMLDTGHLMSTNPSLRTEAEGLEYIRQTVEGLGELRHLIKGVHLHQSLSGAFLQSQNYVVPKMYSSADIVRHIGRIDYHASWTDKGVRDLIDFIAPEWLVYEFLQKDMAQWREQIKTQFAVMGGKQ